MCGITAVSRADDRSAIPDLRTFAMAAALAIEDRGPHATGFGWTDEIGHPWYWKSEGRARDVVRFAPLDRKMRELIGHTRWATLGSPKVDGNNHPVMAPGLILVHNGIVSNHAELFGALGVEREAEVDSEALAALLAYGSGVFDGSGPADLLTLVEGDFAIAWLDADEPHVLHLARGAGRPMAIGWTRRGDLVMASTRAALSHLAKVTKVHIGQVENVPEGTYLRVEAGRITTRQRFAVPVKPERKPTPVGAGRATRGQYVERAAPLGLTERMPRWRHEWLTEYDRFRGWS